MKEMSFYASASLAIRVIGERESVDIGPGTIVGVTGSGRTIRADGGCFNKLPPMGSVIYGWRENSEEDERIQALQKLHLAEVDPTALVKVTLSLNERRDADLESVMDSTFFQQVLAELGQPGWRIALAAADAQWQAHFMVDRDNAHRLADDARDTVLLEKGDQMAREWVIAHRFDADDEWIDVAEHHGY